MQLRITISEDAWDPIGDEEDAWSRILLRDGVTVNGTGFHLEGWSVTVDAETREQRADYQDEYLGSLHHAVGADGHWETIEIRSREYVLAMTPHC